MGRGICCILETHQTPDGIRVPDVLVPYMGGMTFIPFIRGPRDGDGSDLPPRTIPASAQTPATVAGTLQPHCSHPTKFLADGVVQLDVLDAELKETTYAGGFVPSQLDVKIFSAIGDVRVDRDRHPNVARWRQHIGSFNPAQRRSW